MSLTGGYGRGGRWNPSPKVTFPSSLGHRKKQKYVELESFLHKYQETHVGELILVKNSKITLNTGREMNNSGGSIHSREELLQTRFGLIVARTKNVDAKEFWFMTNNLEPSPREMAQTYRKRWDNDVFFRSIKKRAPREPIGIV
jgi:IS4 transposase